MKRLKAHATKLLEDERPVILGGDFNVMPEAIDVYDPKGWEADGRFVSSRNRARRGGN